MKLRRTIASALLVCLAACTPLTEHADLVVRNGTIYTVDPKQPWARALAVRGGKISFVGGEEDIAAHIGASTRIIDAGGRFIMPGFHDAHVHLSLTASKREAESVAAIRPRPCASVDKERWCFRAKGRKSGARF